MLRGPAVKTKRQSASLMTSLSSDKPALVIIAGPNGFGKSTVYSNAKLAWEGRDVWIVNPDLLTARLGEFENLAANEANLAAVSRIETWLYSSIEVHQTVGVETVLSTDKYKRLVAFAKAKGFEFWLIYVALDSVERNIKRVEIRVKKGGHHVPPDKIRDRYTRSLANLKWFLGAADRAWVYDNSGADPKQVASKENGVVKRHAKAPDALDRAIDGIE